MMASVFSSGKSMVAEVTTGIFTAKVPTTCRQVVRPGSLVAACPGSAPLPRLAGRECPLR